MKITAAVTAAKGAPFGPEELDPGELRPGEMLGEGGSMADIFLPRMMELNLTGRLPVERLMTFYDFDQIEQAAPDAETGVAIKSVLRMS